MAFESIRWRAVWPALLLAMLAWLPGAAVSQRGPQLAAGAQLPDEDPNNARVIVKFRAGSALALSAARGGRSQHAGKMGERLALPLINGRPLGPQVQGLRGKGLSSRQLVARLQAQADVEWAVVDQRRTIAGVLPNDPYYGAGQASITPAVGQWYLRAPDSDIVSAINAEGAWALSTGSAAITVAVLDTGVRFDHPDLVGKLWPGYDFVTPLDKSNDGGGLDADASDPGDWTNDGECGGGKSATESSWHGTQVAGLIGAATDNSLGMASVGRQVMVLPVRVLGKCGGFDTDIIAAMRWAGGLSSDPVANPHPAQVINLSLGGAGNCSAAYQSVLAQLSAARVTVVVAAGNTTGLAVNSPANCPDAIAVAGVRHAGTKVGYSSLGPQVALAAPAGNCVNTANRTPCLYPLLTTINLGTTVPAINTYSDSFNTSLGTSFAAPLVAGTAALMLSVDATLTPAQIKSALQATARAFPGTGAQTVAAVACVAPTSTTQVECYCTASTCGAGMLDSGAALARISGVQAAPIAVITTASNSPTLGDTVSLEGISSSRSVVASQWALTSGGAIARFSSSTTDATTTLTTTGAGTVTFNLTVTDSRGVTAAASKTINIVAPPTAAINAPAVTPIAGSSFNLTGTGSANGGRTITAYEWTITRGANLASVSASANDGTATLNTTGAGTLVVSLTVTDSGGATGSASQAITVAAAPVVVTPAASSGGGGALGLGWLLGLASAVVVLARRR